MRDDDDRLALRAHAAQDGKQLFDLLRREHRRRLVQDQKLRLTIERLQEFHTLLLPDRQMLNRRVWINRQPELFGEFANPLGRFC